MNPIQRKATSGLRLALMARVCAAALMLAVFGCAKVNETLTLNADGSGTVEIAVTPLFNTGNLMMMEQALPAPQFAYPPVRKQDAHKLFPAELAAVKVETRKDKEKDKETETVVVKAEFKRVEDLLLTPYAKARGLVIEADEQQKTLVVKSDTGLALLAGLDVLNNNKAAMPMPVNIADLLKARDQMTAAFKLVLPAAPASAGGKVEGNTVTWSIAPDAARPEALNEALRKSMVASCPLAAVKFAPPKPAGLGRAAFDLLKEGATGQAAAAVDPAPIKAAAKFVPVVLAATRSFDISGEGYSENSANLQGVLVLPASLKPQRFGDVKLLEVSDQNGESLLVANQEGRNFRRHHMGFSMPGAEKKEPEKDIRHSIDLQFKPPAAQSKTLKSLKAEIDLVYGGTDQIFKIKDALTPQMVSENFDPRSIWQPNGQVLNHAKLNEAGFQLKVAGAFRSPNLIGVLLQNQSTTGELKAVQLYSADGQPCQTIWSTMGMMGGDDQQSLLLVPSSAKPPYSLAVLVNGSGTKVTVPIEMRDVPVEANELTPPKK